jgi:exodeoxyribonuclease VII small subunit
MTEQTAGAGPERGPGPGTGATDSPTGATAPATVAVPPELAELSYEQARAELAAVVERLEAGGCTLEDALLLWERGEALAEVCQRRLDGARARLDRATTAAGAGADSTPPEH